MRFGWRTTLIATGEPVTDDDLRSMMKRRLLSGGKRTWVTEHFVIWSQVKLEGERAEALQELRKIYESNQLVRQESAAADSQRMFEKWIMKDEGGLDASGERAEPIACDEVHIVDAPSDSETSSKKTALREAE